MVSSIGNPATSEGKRVANEFAALINRPLRLVPVPELPVVRAWLSQEFPYGFRGG